MAVGKTVLWSAGMPPEATLIERIDAAAAAGYDELTLTAADGDGDWEKAARHAQDVGVGLSILDGLTGWYPYDPPKRVVSAIRPIDEVLDVAERFGCETVNAAGIYPTSVSLEVMAEHFAALGHKVTERGMRLSFEFTPRSPIDDIVKATKLLDLSGAPNAGLLFDTWHFYRVNPDFDALARLGKGRIFSVQVSDGTDTFVENLLADTFRHRLLPGEGTFDLPGVLKALDAVDGLAYVGPEVLSVDLFAHGAMETARRTMAGLDHVLSGIPR